MTHGHRWLIGLPAFLVFLGACDDATGPPPPPPDPPLPISTVRGSVEALTDEAPFTTLSSPVEARAGPPTPDSVISGNPRSDGTIRPAEDRNRMTLTTSYVLGEVPAGRTSLVVTVLDRSGDHLGRVLVQSRTRPAGTFVNEPITMETTLEGAIAMRGNLGKPPAPRGTFNNPKIALVHRLRETSARAAAGDTSRIRDLTEAYERAQRVFLEAFGETALDLPFDSLRVRADLFTQAGQPYADARAGGTSVETAHDAFIEDANEVYLSETGSALGVAVAWGAFGTVHDARLAAAGDAARLELARNVLHVSTAARMQILDELDDGAARTAVRDALAAALEAGRAAGAMAELEAAVNEELRAGVAEVERILERDLPEDAADLGRFLDPVGEPEVIAASLPDFMSRLAEAEADPTARMLLLALMAGPVYGEN